MKFLAGAPVELAETDSLQHRLIIWKPWVLERALRINTFAEFLLAGLSAPKQDVFWVFDQESIVSNPECLTLLTEMLARISSN